MCVLMLELCEAVLFLCVESREGGEELHNLGVKLFRAPSGRAGLQTES